MKEKLLALVQQVFLYARQNLRPLKGIHKKMVGDLGYLPSVIKTDRSADTHHNQEYKEYNGQFIGYIE